MLRFLLTPKWIALTLVCLLTLPAFQELSEWQWRRLDQRQTFNQGLQAQEDKSPVPLSELVIPNSNPVQLAPDSQWRTVELTGTWIESAQVLVRRQSLESDLGLWVLTPMKLIDGTVVIVNLGWTAAANSAMDSPGIAALPTGQVEVLGRVREVTPRTEPGPTDLPSGQVDRVAPAEVFPSNSTVDNAYVEMIASRPESTTQDIRALPAPKITEGDHRSYAVQWVIFEIMTVIGWLVLVRNEVMERRKTDQSVAPDVSAN